MIFLKLSNILNDINKVLLPPLCFGCNARLYRGEHLLCTLCRNQLPLTEYNFMTENPVDRIFYGRTDVSKAAAFLYYHEDGIVKNLIHYLKYRKQQQLGTFLGEWFGQDLMEAGLPAIPDYIIPVPLHPRKQRQRGYNQVDNFGKALARVMGSEFRTGLLLKTANVRTQTRKDRFFRWQSQQELYTLADGEELRGKKVLLVDDVITTGATLEACSLALQKAGDVEVYIAAMAVVP
ncbi:ComF family protein [Zeaxanthinibacter enoshimensis]|uniref:ComF family protein n=2 Tax=Zeaxanthinibacter enoshimensis TaxID=392009 RepID=A0A4R6TRE9_9FLAO|nr:ComF family protein [Zeaxanthinibacter enoshimensis]